MYKRQLVNVKAVDKVETLVADAIAKGATLLAGGRIDSVGKLFFQPTVLGGISPRAGAWPRRACRSGRRAP